MNKEVQSVIDKINKEYLLLLEKLSSDFFDEKYLRYVVNEVSLFWSRKRKEVLFIIEYLGNDNYNATFLLVRLAWTQTKMNIFRFYYVANIVSMMTRFHHF